MSLWENAESHAEEHSPMNVNKNTMDLIILKSLLLVTPKKSEYLLYQQLPCF